MAYDEGLAERVRAVLNRRAGVIERKMFGGLAFMLHGHMFVGILGETLMARVGPERYETALREPHVRQMDFTGRPMRGYVYVAPEGIDGDAELKRWVEACVGFVGTLPEK